MGSGKLFDASAIRVGTAVVNSTSASSSYSGSGNSLKNVAAAYIPVGSKEQLVIYIKNDLNTQVIVTFSGSSDKTTFSPIASGAITVAAGKDAYPVISTTGIRQVNASATAAAADVNTTGVLNVYWETVFTGTR